jgi:hypothetical protein
LSLPCEGGVEDLSSYGRESAGCRGKTFVYCALEENEEGLHDEEDRSCDGKDDGECRGMVGCEIEKGIVGNAGYRRLKRRGFDVREGI